ncbi:receptor protein kinase-like protein At4g34220 [Cucurbita pepo subsp. pepo]|uniref:receptor protein kinase-like protein At4g34220 n=1 Tax=Cucurbita pepo subsp. pepo TaxID=3664 RepID=UPI000C9D9650|nr:receptor protein kinase-like protein At4g34220 [Cucurbita pepo subsp. pepo]XP_023552757.1 receptor protein kinase-like protein At4g34220 [Cucurbita pepo subsp. pepo]
MMQDLLQNRNPLNFFDATNKALFWSFTFFFPLLHFPSFALNSDGALLLSLKRSILGDPLSVFANWNVYDATPCSWRGVTCTDLRGYGGGWPDFLRVTAVSLPASQLLGSIPDELGRIEHLRLLDLSGNFFNGSLPVSIFNASELQILSLSNNVISGELPADIGGLRSLQVLNLSDNAFAGKVPGNLTALKNLTVVSLRSNYFAGEIPGNFSWVEVLDLSSNLLNGSLPADFGGEKLRSLNFSYNKISGPVPPEFAKWIPANATMDLSFNNLTGAIPQSAALLSQKTEAFAGNEDLCGKPLKHLCSIHSSLTIPPNVSEISSSSPAIAAIPKTIGSIPATKSPGGPNGTQTNQPQNTMKPITIAAIAVGDLAGITILAIGILYVYHHRKQTSPNSKTSKSSEKKPPIGSEQDHHNTQKIPSSVLFCLANKGEDTSEATSSSDGEEQSEKSGANRGGVNRDSKKNGVLVTLDGETEMELETLLKASAYILGASGGSIVYKAVLEDGTAFAVRRIGDVNFERLRDFEAQMRAIAKLRHQNLVKIRGFFWGEDEKLIIYDYVSNGCLATSIHKKQSSSSSSQIHLSFEVRLKIARGIARGMAFIHDKKHVHGNLKPSNILLNADMEPLITDLGLNKLLSRSSKIAFASTSSRNFGSHRSTPNRDHHDGGGGGSPAVSVGSAYQAPESLKNLKPSPKWDVYSFGLILVELLSGKIAREGGVEDEGRMKKMVDPTIRGELEGKEEAVMEIFRLGFRCACLVPQKRPTMREAVQVLEKICSSQS